MKATTALAIAMLLAAGGVHAQSGSDCPTLPAGSELAWEKLDGAGYTFCKALRDSDGHQVLAVMITTEAPFRPRRANRTQETLIDGTQNWWYRSELSGMVGVEVRETLVELDRAHVAHISLRGRSEQELSQAISLAESLRFDDVRVSIR
ncbi:hypothetical protein [Luteimonas terricola]|uniref:Uncharacterized protein n=1 Tax=Luteimonas terricola TaxID=645597 RepID=A0ABQ2EL51_9GAMM|nr:hypothetical protein [Luteimonas terricola]GGK11781.1 hypothetical protein GCM10011394_21310 [Luteimonas terricola]